MNQIRKCFLVVAALLLSLGGCDSPSELARLDPLTITFNHLHQPEQIGRFTLGWDRLVNVRDMPTAEAQFSFNQLRYEVSNFDWRTVIFLLYRNRLEDDWSVVHLGGDRSQSSDTGFALAASDAGGLGHFDGTITAFLVDGIGPLPAEPITLTLVADGYTTTLTIDPLRHVVRPRLLRVGLEDVTGFPNGIISLSSASEWPATPVMVATTANYNWLVFGSRITGNRTGYYQYLVPPEEEPEFYFFLVR